MKAGKIFRYAPSVHVLWIVFVGVIVSFCLSIIFSWLNIEGGVVIGGLTGMFIAVCVARVRGEQK